MQLSENKNELFTALSKAQIEIEIAVFDKKANYGPYASFKSVREASIKALSKNGLSIIQPVSFENNTYRITTILAHSSGQYLSAELNLILDRQNMQGLGSAITYAKRYAWSAIIGIVSDDDDDGQLASKEPEKKTQSKPKEQSKPQSKEPSQLELLYELVENMQIQAQDARAIIKQVTGKNNSKDLTGPEALAVMTYIKENAPVERD